MSQAGVLLDDRAAAFFVSVWGLMNGSCRPHLQLGPPVEKLKVCKARTGPAGRCTFYILCVDSFRPVQAANRIPT